MYCTRCGAPIPDNASYCTACGAKQNTRDAPPSPPAAGNPGPVRGQNAPRQGEISGETFIPAPAEPGKKPFPILALIIPLIVLVLGIAVLLGWHFLRPKTDQVAPEGSGPAQTVSEPARTNNTSASKDAAVEEAAEALLAGDYTQAEWLIESIDLSSGDALYSRASDILTAARYAPKIQGVDTSDFPTVRVNLSCTGSGSPEIRVSENGSDVPDVRTEPGTGNLAVIYRATSVDGGVNQAAGLVLTMGGASVTLDYTYTIPYTQQASMRFVSADVSEYPIIKVYFRIEDPGTGECVNGLSAVDFTLRESIRGGGYLEREVSAVSRLEGQGLNIDLVADKSDSISYSDMVRIKNVMTEFVRSLNFSVGDRAEVLAFDSIVQQMCAYTNNSALLINGINNMSTDGSTALYDAVYTAVRHAALQGGARCVIAFTDGQDNISYHTAADVIQYALDNQVPIYMIGVGSYVDRTTLYNIAESTGDRYWYIDDLFDMQSILREVYSEQQELYVIEYRSDSAAIVTDSREIDISFCGAGCHGEQSSSFTPVQSVLGEHTSRYEIFRENLTWEQAAQRCEEMGGHLATITSREEQNTITAMAERAGVEYLWLGGYTSYDDSGRVFGHWVTGEDFSFSDWNDNEPSRVDADGTPEWYIMLWYLERFGGWHWNDQRNNPTDANPGMSSGMGFVCEFED